MCDHILSVLVGCPPRQTLRQESGCMSLFGRRSKKHSGEEGSETGAGGCQLRLCQWVGPCWRQMGLSPLETRWGSMWNMPQDHATKALGSQGIYPWTLAPHWLRGIYFWTLTSSQSRVSAGYLLGQRSSWCREIQEKAGFDRNVCRYLWESVGEIQGWWVGMTDSICCDPICISKKILRLPLQSSGSESACPCRGHRLDPLSGKIPRVTGQLSPCATTTEPKRCNYWSPHILESTFHDKRSHCDEKPAHHS